MTTSTTRILHPRRLLLARVLIGALLAGTLLLYLVTLPARFDELVNAPDWGVGYADALRSTGITPRVFAAYMLGMELLATLATGALTALVFARRSDDWMAMLVCGSMFFSVVVVSPPLNTLNPLLVGVLGALSLPMIHLALLLFPDGRFVPRWWARALFITVPLTALTRLIMALVNVGVLAPSPLVAVPLLATVGIMGGSVASQFYRYARAASAVQRQQGKWALVGLTFPIAAVILLILVSVFVPDLRTPAFLIGAASYNVGSLLWLMVSIGMVLIGLVVTAATLAMSMMRYRLWDVDLALNRAIVSVLVALLLGALFVAAMVMRRVLFAALLGDSGYETGVALGASAVLGVVLFNPLRRAVQRFVDRRLFGLNFDLNQLADAGKGPHVKNPGALTGRTIGGCQIGDLLGQGGMGEVYKGSDSSGRALAIKVLPPGLAEQAEFVARFQREAEALRALDHPAIVRMHGAGASDGTHYLALDFVDGADLSHYLKERGALPLPEARALLADVAAALDYAHARGIVHRDVKPSNVLLRGGAASPRAVLTDFGVARLSDASTRYTGTGANGTIDYMAPEQIVAAKTVDARADVYALGVVAYQMLTGQLPFSGGAAQVMFAHLQQPAPDPRTLVPELPHDTAEALLRALAKAPEERFETASAFVRAL